MPQFFLGDKVELINVDHPELETYEIGDKFIVIGVDSYFNGNEVYLYLHRKGSRLDHIPKEHFKPIKPSKGDKDVHH